MTSSTPIHGSAPMPQPAVHVPPITSPPPSPPAKHLRTRTHNA